MAVEVPYSRFGEFAGLFNGAVFGHARAEAALLHPESRLFVDDATIPRVAMLCLRGDDIWLLAGAPDRGAARTLVEHVARTCSSANHSLIVRPADPMLEALAIEEFAGQVTLTRILQYTFDRAAEAHVRSWRERLGPGCEVRRVDVDLARRIDSAIDVDFPDLWPDADEFAARGVAFCLLWSGRPVSLAWSYGPPGKMMEIAVGTAADARGHGFCPLAACALLEYCLDHKIEPVWLTVELNLASQAVATKVGFVDPLWHHWLTCGNVIPQRPVAERA